MNLSEILKKIEEEQLQDSRWQDGDYLSDLLLRLSSYYASLSKFTAEADQDMNLAEVHYKVSKEQIKKDLMSKDNSIAASEAEAEIRIREDKETYIKLRYKAKLLQYTRDNLGRSMDAIRSKLSYMRTERENS